MVPLYYKLFSAIVMVTFADNRLTNFV